MILKNKKFYFYLILVLFLIFQCIVAVTHGWDLDCYIRASKRILNDQPLYTQESIPYIYPPFLAFALIPVSYLNTILLNILWFLSSLLFIYYAVLLMGKIVEKDYHKSFLLYSLPLFFTLRFIMDNFALGQVNIIIMYILVLTLYFFVIGKDFYAGLFLGMSISIKLTPILILFYFIFKREFRITLYTIISIFFFLLIPAVTIGFRKNIEYIFQYFHLIRNFSDTTINNQSLFITIKRLLSPIPPWDNLYINIATLDEFYIKLITFSIFGIITLFLCYLFRYKIKNRKDVFYEYSLIIICMLFFSSLSRKAHFVLILMPQFFLFYYILKNNTAPGIKLIKFFIGMSFVLNTITSEIVVIALASIYNKITSASIVGSDLSDIFESYSCVTIGTFLLFVNLCIIQINGLRKGLFLSGDEKS